MLSCSYKSWVIWRSFYLVSLFHSSKHAHQIALPTFQLHDIILVTMHAVQCRKDWQIIVIELSWSWWNTKGRGGALAPSAPLCLRNCMLHKSARESGDLAEIEQDSYSYRGLSRTNIQGKSQTLTTSTTESIIMRIHILNHFHTHKKALSQLQPLPSITHLTNLV